MAESPNLLNALLNNAFRGTPMATMFSGLNAAGVAAADGVALFTGLSGAITGTSAPAAAGSIAGDDDAKALLIAKAMISAAKSDGVIDEDERLNILSSLAEAGVSPSVRTWVDEEMKAPLDMDGLVAAVSDAKMAGEAFTASLMAIKVDTDAERTYLAALADRLGLKKTAAEAA